MSNRKFLKSQVKIARKHIRHLLPHEREGIDKVLHGDTLPDWLIKARKKKR